MSRSKHPSCPRGRGCGVCRNAGQSQYDRYAMLEREEMRDAEQYIASKSKLADPGLCYLHDEGLAFCPECYAPVTEDK